MASAMLMCVVCLCACICVDSRGVWTPGKNKIATKFVAGALPGRLSTSRRSYAMRRARKKHKPLMVILTRAGCGACQNLKQSVNHGTALRKRLSEGGIIVVHAEGVAADEWKIAGHPYVPQTHFYAPGEDRPLPIHGRKDNQPFYLHDEQTLLWAVNVAIDAVKTGKRGANDPGNSNNQMNEL